MISASSLATLSSPALAGASAAPRAGVQTIRSLSTPQATGASSGTLRFDPAAPPPTKTLPRGSLLNLSA